MKLFKPNERRNSERRQATPDPPPYLGELRRAADANGSECDSSSQSAECISQRRKRDRRVADRRQVDLGPPSGTGERRFRPDRRGVVFLYVDDNT